MGSGFWRITINTYALYLKSYQLGIHDFEDEIEARSKREAVKLFRAKHNLWDWPEDILFKNIEKVPSGNPIKKVIQIGESF